jgi:hypothetical protein
MNTASRTIRPQRIFQMIASCSCKARRRPAMLTARGSIASCAASAAATPAACPYAIHCAPMRAEPPLRASRKDSDRRPVIRQFPSEARNGTECRSLRRRAQEVLAHVRLSWGLHAHGIRPACNCVREARSTFNVGSCQLYSPTIRREARMEIAGATDSRKQSWKPGM